MTVEVKVESTQVVEEVVVLEDKSLKVVDEAPKISEEKKVDEVLDTNIVAKSSSYREESSNPSDLKEHEKKALNELKSKIEEGILGNSLFKKEEPKVVAKPSKEEVKEEESKEEEKEKEICTEEEKAEEEKKSDEGTEDKVAETKDVEVSLEGESVEVDTEISIWGVPLLPSKGADGTDVVLLKFLRAREFKVNEVFEMLRKTLQWRKELKIDLVLDEDLGTDLASASYMSGVDREGYPICYNIFGVLHDEKTLGTEEKRGQFQR